MSPSDSIALLPDLASFVEASRSEFAAIPAARQEQLIQLMGYIRDRLRSSTCANLTFICTHNSRRSHLCQIWSKVAADFYGFPSINTFSGGTEVTALNPSVVDSLRRTGFEIESEDLDCDNPRYRIRYSPTVEPLICFSKLYNEPPNPSSQYAAVMVCSSADDACPVVPGSDLRLTIRYEDPKVADGTPEAPAVYDDRSRQICREMSFMMQQLQNCHETKPHQQNGANPQ